MLDEGLPHIGGSALGQDGRGSSGGTPSSRTEAVALGHDQFYRDWRTIRSVPLGLAALVSESSVIPSEPRTARAAVMMVKTVRDTFVSDRASRMGRMGEARRAMSLAQDLFGMLKRQAQPPPEGEAPRVVRRGR